MDKRSGTARMFEEIEAGSDEERDLRGVWMSRLTLGWIVGMNEERSYEEWLAAAGYRLV